jgi:glutathione synthase
MTALSSFDHILFIDPLEKLVFKKDSSLQLALALKKSNRKVGLLFEEDFYFSNKEEPLFKVYDFDGEFEGSYLKSFDLGSFYEITLHKRTIVHMRIDPPFDTRYLRYLWILRSLKEKWGITVLNDPEGIAVHNEKMVSYELEEAVPTYVGSSLSGFKKFFDRLNLDQDNSYEGLILKPIDLFQGIGVEKVSKELGFDEVAKLFEKKKVDYHGPVVAQPFLTEVYTGELRSLYFDGKELGTIIKTPPEGEFLANIAQGAKYHAVKLEEDVAKRCEAMNLEFSKRGVPWIAYDILGGKIQEANLTCPGLLVEVSHAVGKNLAFDLVKHIENYCQKTY